MTSLVIRLSGDTTLEVAKPHYPEQSLSIFITQDQIVKANEKSIIKKIQIDLSREEFETLNRSIPLIEELFQFCKSQDFQ